MKEVSNKELVEALKKLKGRENEIIAELIKYLSEIDSRKLYREEGYPSLFAYCCKALGYSEGAAYRRIAAARVYRNTPEVYTKLKSGELTLCALVELSKVIKPENKEVLFSKAAGKSKQEVQSVVAQYQAPEAKSSRQESVRARRVTERKPALFTTPESPENSSSPSYTITLQLSQEEMDLINEAQVVLSTARVKDTLLKSAKRVVRQNKNLQLKRDKRVASKNGAEQSPPPVKVEVAKTRSRYVPADVRHAVELRDGGRCSYISPDGVRCCERKGLEFDHIIPYSLGGGSTNENLRLVCRTHNLMYAEQVFGREMIERIVGNRSERNPE